MTDNEKRAHDLALQVTMEILSRDYDVMKNSDPDGNEPREVLASSIIDEYNSFYDIFVKSIK